MRARNARRRRDRGGGHAAPSGCRACVYNCGQHGAGLVFWWRTNASAPGRPYKWRSSALKRRRAPPPPPQPPPRRPTIDDDVTAEPLIVLLHSAFRCQLSTSLSLPRSFVYPSSFYFFFCYFHPFSITHTHTHIVRL